MPTFNELKDFIRSADEVYKRKEGPIDELYYAIEEMKMHLDIYLQR